MLEPPIWNERTGNIVGGHQRVSILDSLHKSANYSLTVAAVSLTEQEEREQNIFLNNGEAQGEWDLEKLNEMFALGMDVDSTGFDPASIIRLFGDVPGEGKGREAEELERVAAAVDAAKKVRSELSKTKTDAYSDDCHYYLVLVGGNDAQRECVTEALGLEDNRYQDLRLLARLMGLAVAKGATPQELQQWASGLFDEECETHLLDPVKATEASPIKLNIE